MIALLAFFTRNSWLQSIVKYGYFLFVCKPVDHLNSFGHKSSRISYEPSTEPCHTSLLNTVWISHNHGEINEIFCWNVEQLRHQSCMVPGRCLSSMYFCTRQQIILNLQTMPITVDPALVHVVRLNVLLVFRGFIPSGCHIWHKQE